MTNDHISDEEALDAGPSREEILTRSTAPAGRKLGELTLRAMTSETFTYLWHVKNFFLSGVMGKANSVNSNPVWSTAEFVYIHAADLDEVANAIWDAQTHRNNVREFLRGPLNTPTILTEALPIIEDMVREYFAAQNQSAAASQSPHAASSVPGKKPARAGKRHT